MYPINFIGKAKMDVLLWQGGGLNSATSNFQSNFFYGVGIGYWFFFLILAVAAAIWVYYDSQKRNLDALAFRIGTWVAVVLLLPALLFKLTVRESEVAAYFEIEEQIAYLQHYQEGDWLVKTEELQRQLDNQFQPLTGFIEAIMYLGLIGGLGGPILAVAYYFTYQGRTGHEPSSPVPISPIDYGAPPPPPPPLTLPPDRDFPSPGPAPRPSKPTANAWLVSSEGQNYQLYMGETTLGRSSANDIQITGDTTLSKTHAKIVEQNGHFKIYDLGSLNGTRVNQRRVRQPMMLAPNDEIQLGDNTILKFVTGQ